MCNKKMIQRLKGLKKDPHPNETLEFLSILEREDEIEREREDEIEEQQESAAKEEARARESGWQDQVCNECLFYSAYYGVCRHKLHAGEMRHFLEKACKSFALDPLFKEKDQ